MDRRIKRYFDKRLNRQAVKRWRGWAGAAETVDLSTLQDLRGGAKTLRRHLDEVIRVADARLALPRIGATAMHKPTGADWSWRPPMWRLPLTRPGRCAVTSGTQLDDQVKLFHDCPLSEITLRQLRSRREADLAPFHVQMDVLEFQGGFLSLVVDVPPEGLAGLSREHILRLDSIVQTERPQELFARLNLRFGARSDQVVQALPRDGEACFAEFDLAYTAIEDTPIDAAWLDLIVEKPRFNQIVVRDLTLSRRLRAQL